MPQLSLTDCLFGSHICVNIPVIRQGCDGRGKNVTGIRALLLSSVPAKLERPQAGRPTDAFAAASSARREARDSGLVGIPG